MNNPRVLIAAPSSGSGKTTVTCGIIRALKRRGMTLASYKCGPDFIDPLFHERVLGIPSGNLDLFFSDADGVRRSFLHGAKGADLSVIEGVMGYYDGLSASSWEASAYHTAQVLASPVILVVNARGQALSALAELRGFADYMPLSRICGVIFNQMSESVYDALRDNVRSMGIEPLGFLPKMGDIAIESRHLGLKTPQDIKDVDDRLDRLADITGRYIDLDAIIRIAQSAEKLTAPSDCVPDCNYPVTVAVARDEAFCFMYRENIALLERYGANVVYFSPLHDRTLPCGTQGIILTGGYPELFAEELSSNTDMLTQIKNAIDAGMPTLAECGGFMYLHNSIEGADGKDFPMCRVIDARAYRTDRLGRFGYITLCADRENPYLGESEKIKAHEFHYWDSESCGDVCRAQKPGGKTWDCIYTYKNLFAGFPHLFYESDRDFIARFLSLCGR